MMKFDLGFSMSPFVECETITKHLERRFFVKREDALSSTVLSSTDARKIEFLIVDIANSGLKDVVVYGSYTSPFIRMLASVLCRYDVTLHVYFVNQFSPDFTLNLSMIQMYGAKTYGTVSVEELISIRESFGDHFFVEEGGGNTSALMGGFALFDEIKLNLDLANLNKAVIYVGIASGTTFVGMLAASSVSYLKQPHDIRIVGVPIFNDLDKDRTAILQMLENKYNLLRNSSFSEQYESHSFDQLLNYSVYKSLLPVGQVSENSINVGRDFAQKLGFVVDPLYGLNPVMTAYAEASSLDEDCCTVFVNPTAPILPYFNYTGA
jgi:1-aminocyclopropane-1-carboxylate deaminase/D-cysteine desulfhydrase-like pyridoxal-dependent ACC family enzyme